MKRITLAFRYQLHLASAYLVAIGLLLLATSPLAAQGFLIATNNDQPVPLPRPIVRPQPVPPMTYKISQLAVNARIIDQVAQVQVTQSFVNTGSRQMETRFVFPLPYDGAIDSLTLMVDGKEFPAQLMTSEKAREIYEGFMRRNQDPALLEWLGTGMFQTSIFPVPAGAERKITLTYKQILRKDHSLTDFIFPLGTAKYTSAPVDNVEINASIESAIAIKSVYSPSHAIDVKRPDAHHAVISYQAKNEVPNSDFRMFWDVKEGKVGAAVLSFRPDKEQDGYFLMLASPDVDWSVDERPRKTVVCVFDRSGSMSGKKIEQAREALKFVLNNLQEGDLFNIVAYDSEIESFKPELERYNDKSRKEALGFVNSIYAGGGTNIDGALSTALEMVQDSKRANYVLFMTDGQPTIGETNESKIVQAAEKNNELRARVISFGVGYDVNSRLLDRISRACFGATEYVKPDEDIEQHVARLYGKISSPVMTDIALAFELDEAPVEAGPPITRVYPKRLSDLFQGEQLVVVGRYRRSGPAKVNVKGNIGDKQQKFAFPTTLAEVTDDDKYAFVEKLWAMRRVGELIDEIDLHGKNDELIKELIQLSTKHGILTPYTSFLADDTGTVHDLADARLGRGQAREKAGEALDNLAQAEGKSGFDQRVSKKEWQEASRVVANAPVAELGDDEAGGPAYYDFDAGKRVSTSAVRNVGNSCVYRRGKLWIATNCTELDPEKDKDKIKVVKRYSDEYFTLASANTKEENNILARQRVGEELMISLRGQAYRFVD